MTTKRRVLVLVHEDLVPPEDYDSLSEAEQMELKTEYDVCTGLEDLGHDVLPLGLGDDLAPLRQATQKWKPHIVFNLLEEFRGEPLLDQNVVSYLELVGIPYTGCNPRGLMIARDKALSKKILHYHRIRTPRFAVFPIGRKVKRPKSLDFPLFVKSAVEEASAGISEASVVWTDDKLAERVAFMHHSVGTPALVEQFIEGRELYVGVVGDTRLQVFPAWELHIDNLRADAPKIATRRVKWDLAYQERRGVRTARAQIDAAIERELVRTTKRLYRALGLSGYARIDFRLDNDGHPWVLEANPNPDIMYGGEFAETAEAGGLEYEALLQRILNLGLSHRRQPSAAATTSAG